MPYLNFNQIIQSAWKDYDPSRPIKAIADISAKVSTNHVYKVFLENQDSIIAKLSYFGKYEHFVEDHTIINCLANNLPHPFENFLSRSLIKRNSLFVHRFENELIDAWVVFYRPVLIKERLPRILDIPMIKQLGQQFAKLHKACYQVRNTLPPSSKTLLTDIAHLLRILRSDFGQYEHRQNEKVLEQQSELLSKNLEDLGFNQLPKIPVFVDWNIGNFSISSKGELYSRWDYDWFRMSSRMLDFYFLSRIVSSIGDRTVFSYNVDTLMEERFLIFLQAYHAEYPLSKKEVYLLKEVYRFFILNYVIKDGRYFFHEIYATKLQKEAYDHYFPSIDTFDAAPILEALKI